MGGENERQRRAAAAYRKSQGTDENDSQSGSVGRTDREKLSRAASEPGSAGTTGDLQSPAFEKVGGEAQVRSERSRSTRARSAVGPEAVAPPQAAQRPATPSVGHPSAVALHEAGPERAARLLIAMGAERAAQVLALMEPTEIEQIAARIVSIPAVRASEAHELLASIDQEIAVSRMNGGPNVAREMLVAAFGEDRGESLFRAVLPDAVPHFAFLDDVEPHQLRVLFRDESPAVIAMILTHLASERAAQVIGALPVDQRSDVARRVARMGRLNRDVVVRVEDALREKIRRQGRQVTQGVDGSETLAAILRHMAPSSEGEILHALERENPDVSHAVRERLFTSDLLLQVSDRDLADLMREFDDRELALFIKGKSEELRSRVLAAVSERRRIAISEEYAHLGPQKRSDVDAITHELLEHLRELEEEGSILVPREGDRYI